MSLIAALLVVLAGCGGGPVNRGVANAVKAQLPQVVGPADSWDVDVTGNPGTIIRGRVPCVLIHGVNVRMSPQLTMDTLDITAKDIHVDIAKRELKNIDSLTFCGALNQYELDHYMAATASGSKRPDNLQVKLSDADMSVSFAQKLSFVSIPVQVDGRLNVSTAGDNKIDFIPSAISIAKINLPRELVNYSVKAINPAIDLSTMTFPVHLKSIRVTNRRVVFAGSAEIPPAAFAAAKQQTANAR